MSAERIKVVGAGLIGTSLGLALSKQGIDVGLENRSKANLRLAIEYGAGSEAAGDYDLVVVCVSPEMTAEVVAAQLEAHPNALVTDVASVKAQISRDVAMLSPDSASRYVGSHPMAGREKGGPGAARADLFFARPWVITPTADAAKESVDRLKSLANQLGALPVVMSPEEHDEAVALVSHLPQLVSSALAARLQGAKDPQLNLSGQGLRDASRIASSDPDLWLQILSQNSRLVAPLLAEFKNDITELVESLERLDEAGSLAKLHSLLERGNAGVSRIPGKHGGKFVDYHLLTVVIDDSPGALASLLTFIGEVGVNIEDLKLEHSPGAEIGLVEIQVLPEASERLSAQLTQNGWRLV
ncbi:MAG: prephenate dehydrogenase [Aquiluna sp.]